MDEALLHSHNRARDSYVEADGWMQPRPAPRFLATEPVMPTMWHRDSHRDAILQGIGIDEAGDCQIDGWGGSESLPGKDEHG